MSKYDPLEDHFNMMVDSGRYEWNASFNAVEKILGFKLPPSARTYPEWWANEDLSYTLNHSVRLGGGRVGKRLMLILAGKL